MIGEQTRTYLLYSRGLMPDDLTLGSLHLDPANPIDNESKFFHNDAPIDATWLRRPQHDEPCSVSAQASRTWLVKAGFASLLQGELGAQRSADIAVSGSAGRRVQFKDPEAFLNNVILTSEAARSWLASKLTLLHRMPLLARIRQTVSKPPSIWMVTGLQYIEQATVSSAANATRSVEGNILVTVPDPTLVAVMADIPAVQSGISSSLNESAGSNYGHQNERVWAAQFRPLKVMYRLAGEEAMGQSSSTSPTWIKLLDPENFGRHGIRNDGDGAEDQGLVAAAAQVTVTDDGITEPGHVVNPRSMLDTMMDVDWSFLYEMLEKEYEMLEKEHGE